VSQEIGEAERIDLDRLRRNYEAFGQGAWDQAQELLDPDITWHDPPQMAGGACTVERRPCGVHGTRPLKKRGWSTGSNRNR
jgi:hypothetical protein